MSIGDRRKARRDNRGIHRKGMVIELALLMMLVTFACAALLVSSAIWGRQGLDSYERKMIERSVVDEFAERVLAEPDWNLQDADERFYGYTYYWEPDLIFSPERQYLATLFILNGSETVLHVRVRIDIVDRHDNSASLRSEELVLEMQILEWVYH